MTEGNKDRLLPKDYAKGLINNLKGHPPGLVYRPVDLEDPAAVTKMVVDISRQLGIDPPVTTWNKLDECLEVAEITDRLEPSDNPSSSLTEGQLKEALRRGAEDEIKAFSAWSPLDISPEKPIPKN